jgi:hypothetical protein
VLVALVVGAVVRDRKLAARDREAEDADGPTPPPAS